MRLLRGLAWRARIVAPAVVLLVAALGTFAVIDLYLRQRAAGQREIRVERRVLKVERRVVLTPCEAGSDAVCRAFIDRLLSAATARQLARLRGHPGISVQELRRALRAGKGPPGKSGGPRSGRP